MVRTQIYLPEAVHRRLKRTAHDQGKAMAELVRELVETNLSAPDPLKAWREKNAKKLKGWKTTQVIRQMRKARWNLS